MTTNLALPGAGSLLAGRAVGVPQILLGLAGLGLTLVCGTRFIFWGFQHYAQLRNPDADPLENLLALWHQVRWALLGLGLFGFSWAWSLLTSWAVMRASRQATPPPLL